MNYQSEFVEVTFSVPRNSFFQYSPDINGNTHVVPDNNYDFSLNNRSDYVIPENQFQAMEKESFYSNFFDCIKSPVTHQTKTSFSNPYNKSNNDIFQKKCEDQTSHTMYDSLKDSTIKVKTLGVSPWRLVVQNDDIVTSSPLSFKMKSTFQPKTRNVLLWRKDTPTFEEFLSKIHTRWASYLPG